ncbi:bifunctional 2-polyprenyl-6-hydroxyphenol methylase/3-demethylubiquinol 3-O-methyltransferase UbiG [Candidatus Curculioniphilus buchneri]|uniref:bifunctional 2-polyprenyl-6-hydroxyphenol methylase/3-demethylubiquinol 3-O-methyltransferase UbiG n=1 Tax=Candidatus Curculioniphilus buchneri TaxID=690594 RepID=UPI00376F0CA3
MSDKTLLHIKKHINNIDFNEIIKFNSVANCWWDPNGAFKVLHQINPIRLDYILNCSKGLFSKNVLDVGCGGGILSESMAREGAKVTGLDISAELLESAKQHALESGISINYIHQTVEHHASIYPGAYDIITCMEVLEHVPNPKLIVQACAKLITPNGEVFFSTLNRNLKTLLIAIIGAEYILRMIPCRTHNFNKFIQPAELLDWIDDTSLHEKQIIGLKYNPFKDQFYLCNNVDVNYILYTKQSI